MPIAGELVTERLNYDGGGRSRCMFRRIRPRQSRSPVTAS